MKEWRGNIVTVVQNPCCSARVPCKQTYSSPRGVAITLPLRRRSTRSLPCFNAEVPRGSQVNRQFESAAPLGYFEARQNPHSYLNYIHFLSVALHTKTLPFRKHEGGARALHTKVATLPGLTRRVTKANTAPAATFQPRLTRCLARKTNCTSPLERRERIACNRIAFEFSLQLFTSTKS